MLAGLLKKSGLKARATESEAISAGHIVSLDAAKAKLVCLSFLGIGSSSAQVRYLVRRLRRILPSGCTILVGYWADDAAGAPVKPWKKRPKPMPMPPRFTRPRKSLSPRRAVQGLNW